MAGEFDLFGGESSGPSYPSGLSLGGGEGAAGIGSGGFSFDLPSLPSLPTLQGQPFGTLQPDAALPQGGGGTFSDMAGKALGGIGGIAKGALPFAQLGLSGVGLKGQLDAVKNARQQSGQIQQAQQVQREAAQPLVAFGRQELDRAGAGKLDPAIQAQIDEWAQKAKIQVQQFFASNKIGDSTMLQSMLNDIDQRAASMRAGNLQEMQRLGISALNQGSQAGTMMAATAGNQEDEITRLIREANQMMAQMGASA